MSTKLINASGNQTPGDDQYLTKPEFAKRLKISLRSVDNMIHAKKIPVIRIGRSVRIRRQAADAALLKYELKAVA